MTAIVGIDVGYGYTKAVSQTGCVIEPSLVGPAVHVRFQNDLAASEQALELKLDGTAWFVGRQAQLQSPFTISPRARERDPEIVRLLALAALVRLRLESESVCLVTGTPVAWYADRDRLASRLVGKHAFSAQGRDYEIEIRDVLVVPQPIGTLFQVLLSPGGVMIDAEQLSDGRVGILDVGTHTTDYAIVDQLRYVEPLSGSISVAMARVYELLQSEIEARSKCQLSLPDVESAARRRSVTLYGKPIAIDRDVERALDAVSQQVLGHAATLWGDGFDLKTILLTGGGGEALHSRIQTRYPHAHLVSNAQAANAEGFYRYGLRKFAAYG